MALENCQILTPSHLNSTLIIEFHYIKSKMNTSFYIINQWFQIYDVIRNRLILQQSVFGLLWV